MNLISALRLICLSFLLIIAISCEKSEEAPSQSLMIELCFDDNSGSYTCVSSQSDGNTIFLPFQQDKIDIRIYEDYIPDQVYQLADTLELLSDYNFKVSVNSDDEELFINNENMYVLQQGTGTHKIEKINYHYLMFGFTVDINFDEKIQIKNDTLELHSSQDNPLTISYKSEFSSQVITKEFIIKSKK